VVQAASGQGLGLAADPGPGAATAPSPGRDPGQSLARGRNLVTVATTQGPDRGPGTAGIAPGPGLPTEAVQLTVAVLPTEVAPGPRIATETLTTARGQPQGHEAVLAIAGIAAGPGTGAGHVTEAGRPSMMNP